MTLTMIQMKVVLVLLGLLLARVSAEFPVYYDICPPDDEIEPCYCDPYIQTITCNYPKEATLNVSLVTSRVGQNAANKTVVFEFVAEDVTLKELQKQDLGSLQFKVIAVLNTGLEVIHSDAFEATAMSTKIIDMANNLLTDEVFEALRKLPNLTYINLSYNRLTTVPSHVFRSMDDNFSSQLRGLLLNGNAIHEISDFAFFYLSNLSELQLESNRLGTIQEKALEWDSSSHRALEINFMKNQLNSSSFEEGALDRINRPVRIDLRNNRLNHLKEAVFRPFLEANVYNKVNVEQNPIACHCDSHWLHRQAFVYKRRVVNHECHDLRLLWEYSPEEFKHCERQQ